MTNDRILHEHRAEISKWLDSQRPQIFFTGTFRKVPTERSALRNSRKFFSSFRPKPDFGFIAIESWGGVRPHNHGLLRFNRCDSKEAIGFLYADWYARFGRARVEAILSPTQVSKYVAKYITKGSLENYFIL